MRNAVELLLLSVTVFTALLAPITMLPKESELFDKLAFWLCAGTAAVITNTTRIKGKNTRRESKQDGDMDPLS
jgi:hypothetical protein